METVTKQSSINEWQEEFPLLYALFKHPQTGLYEVIISTDKWLKRIAWVLVVLDITFVWVNALDMGVATYPPSHAFTPQFLQLRSMWLLINSLPILFIIVATLTSLVKGIVLLKHGHRPKAIKVVVHVVVLWVFISLTFSIGLFVANVLAVYQHGLATIPQTLH
jgi:hypothetical protein